MELRNCAKCGKMIKYTGEGEVLCGKCITLEGDPYRRIREYVYNHQGATIQETSEATGVSSTLILKYLKEGRLSLMDKKSLMRHCEECGVVIEKGSICGICLKKELQLKEQPVYGSNKVSTTGFGRRRRK
ncbi:hypothetical protein [Natronincola ferrireducens]|uniref:Flagellar operon protein TIGR03826 n=1 Tax=Natronincola ferrireducens TaxID=393762 RepID=A0A1G8XPW8_9FIRM|nr:hypothetical protein [Natronincola ferrireducens]SDJ91820.1 hypothetical protein SAMN05660472_00272 [Natronincola ferrireducens]